ncbi:MAG: UDP-N-acetylmuramoyl-tripeptide--D-alanyl-D-alanine ligase [Lachnospiraceae bacterium]|nr:UDP-N-acetylmuramoyl-tripeptide--D-alanyl-D-alanine ligase [Lachnospiraceae bacterium]
MKNLTLENISKACNGKLFLINGDDAEKEASSVIIDSRKCEENCVFIATKGERVDGHSFINQVWDNKALAVICEEIPENVSGNYIHVEDSFKALKDIAEFYRRQLDVKIVGIAGSVGKTSTKEMVSAVLEQKFRVQKTAGNFNNEVGVPLTIFTINETHELAVVEMGISDFGEMSRLSKIVKPDICVMTNIGPCHLENLKDLDGVLKAKSEIFESMNPAGFVVLNGDDDKLRTITRINDKTPRYFGNDKSNDIYSTDIVSKGLLGTECKICTKEGDFKVTIPLPGKHHVLNALAATSVGLILKMDISEIAKGIESVKSTQGRSNIIESEDYILIDDCYNANPKSMKAAIDLLDQANGVKVAILGDMFELGENEEELHGEIGDYISKQSDDLLICIGKLSANIYERATLVGGRKVYYETLEDAIDSIKTIIDEVSVKGEKPAVLIKASHGMHFEKIVEILR